MTDLTPDQERVISDLRTRIRCMDDRSQALVVLVQEGWPRGAVEEALRRETPDTAPGNARGKT